jgi:hypothetical protein
MCHVELCILSEESTRINQQSYGDKELNEVDNHRNLLTFYQEIV